MPRPRTVLGSSHAHLAIEEMQTRTMVSIRLDEESKEQMRHPYKVVSHKYKVVSKFLTPSNYFDISTHVKIGSKPCYTRFCSFPTVRGFDKIPLSKSCFSVVFIHVDSSNYGNVVIQIILWMVANSCTS